MKLETLVKRFGSPLYVYDGTVIRARCRELRKAFPDFRLYYACKANTNPELVRLIHREGFSVECVSPGEVAVAKKAGARAEDIAFTCGSIHERELVSVVKSGVRMHLDSLTQVEQFGRHFPGQEISVRLNLGVGAGHHAHVITGGPDSKFGIDSAHIPALKKIANRYGLHITGLHQHIGSNILEVPMFLKAMEVLFKVAMQFPDLRHLDFGGGLGVPYNPGAKRLDVERLGREVSARVEKFNVEYAKRLELVKKGSDARRGESKFGAVLRGTVTNLQGPRNKADELFGRAITMSIEPGRYLVAEAGTLLATVVDIKKNPQKTFVGVDTGMGHLIRPAMYDSHHTIDNLTRPRAPKRRVTVAGYYCESGDVLAKDRLLPMPRLGDILAIRNAGAYGYTMSSDYNLRPRPAEVLISGGKAKKIRK